ncbi:MAG: T9SS type A sorting domain-containing protein [Chitinophagales bacterium]
MILLEIWFGGRYMAKMLAINETEFVLVVSKKNIETQINKPLLVKISESGDILWQKTYSYGEFSDIPKKLIQSQDKGFLISGFTQNTENGREDAYLVKTDSLGNMEWQQTYGLLNPEGADHALQTEDGGYLVLGERIGSGIRRDIWLFKIDSEGNFMWEKVYINAYHQEANEMIEVEDGYLIVGYDQAGEIGKVRPSGLLMKVDKQGNYLWERTYTGSIFNLELTDQFRAIKELSDGSLVIVGNSENENEYAYHMGLVMKLTAEGDTVWTKTYSNNLNDDHYFWDVEVLEDGGFGICGWGYGIESGTQDGWILKVDSLGNTCQPANCDSIFTTSIHYDITTHYPTHFYPNPAQNRVTFQHRLPKGKEAVLEVYDLKGRLINNEKLIIDNEELVLDIEAWESGLYLYRVRIEGREVSSGKLVVE